MDSFLLYSRLSEVTRYGNDGIVYWVNADVAGFEAMCDKPELLDELREGRIPEIFKFSGERLETIFNYLSARFSAEPQKIPIDDALSELELAAEILAFLEQGTSTMDLLKGRFATFPFELPVVGVYSASDNSELVEREAFVKDVHQEKQHIVSHSSTLPTTEPSTAMRGGAFEQVFRIIKPYLKRSVDQFVDALGVPVMPFMVDSEGYYVYGILQFCDGYMGERRLPVIQINRRLSDLEAARLLTREAFHRLRFPVKLFRTLIPVLYPGRLNSNTGKNRGKAEAAGTNGMNLAKELARTYGLSIPQANRASTEARVDLKLDQKRRPKPIETDLTTEIDEQYAKLLAVRDEIISAIAKKAPDLRARYASEYIRRAKALFSPKAFHAAVEKKALDEDAA